MIPVFRYSGYDFTRHTRYVRKDFYGMGFLVIDFQITASGNPD